MKIWRVGSGQILRSFPNQSRISMVEAVVFGPHNAWVAAASYGDGKVYIWDVNSGRLLRTISRFRDVQSFTFSPDGRLIAAVFSNSQLKEYHVELVDLATEQLLYTLPNAAFAVSFSPDSKLLVLP